MWQLFFLLIGFVFCSHRKTDVETIAGMDVNLECLGISTVYQQVVITWWQSDGTILFECSRRTSPCETNTIIHTLERNDTFISSTVTIRNVSLVHEDEYDITMVSPNNKNICKINLTVNVPPKGLIVVEKNDATALQNQGSLTVAEGEHKTLVCKTNTSVKPSINLEWVILNTLNASVEPQQNVYDGHNKHLLVPTRTIHFTPTYADGDDIVLICNVASNSTHDRIHTSVIIKNEDFTGRGTSYTTHFGPTNQGPTEKPWYQNIRLVIPGCAGVVMLLIVLAFVSGFICSKKRYAGGSAAQATQTSRNLPDDETSHTSKPTSTTGVKPLDMIFDHSDPTYAIPDVSEVPHTYMALNCKSSASTSQLVPHPSTSIDNHDDSVLYISPTLVRKQGKTHSHLKKESIYVNTESASSYCEISRPTDIPNIVKDYTDHSDLTHVVPDVSETPYTYMAMKPIKKYKSSAGTNQHVSHPTTSVGDHDDAVIYVSPTLVPSKGRHTLI